jgi:hypothetical protein
MPKDKVRNPSHKDKYANLASTKEAYHSNSAVLPPTQKGKKRPKPRQEPSDEPRPDSE